MILTDEQTKKFTKTVKYCANYVPVFHRYVPGRYARYIEFACKGGNITQTVTAAMFAVQGLNNGTGPTLKIVKTETVPGHDYISNGFFWARYPDSLFLEERNAAKYEADTAKYEIALQYLVMHELIHWTRYQAGLPADLPGGVEVGDAFEKAAYGRDVSHIWDSGARPYDRGLVL